MQAGLQDFFPRLPQELPGVRNSRELRLRQCCHPSAGIQFVQDGRRTLEHTHTPAYHWMAGKKRYDYKIIIIMHEPGVLPKAES